MNFGICNVASHSTRASLLLHDLHFPSKVVPTELCRYWSAWFHIGAVRKFAKAAGDSFLFGRSNTALNRPPL